MSNDLNDLLILLCRSISTRKLYFANHNKVTTLSKSFTAALEDYLADVDEQALFIGIVEGSLIHNGRKLVGPSIIGKQLIDFAEKLNCGGITFTRSVTSQEIEELLTLTTELLEPTANLAASRELLVARGIQNIELARHYVDPSALIPKEKKKAWQGEDSNELLQSPARIYQALFDVVSHAHGSAAFDRNIEMESARSVSEHLLQHTRTNFADMMQQIHYPDYDTYTVGHSVRVAALAVYVGNALNFPNDILLQVGTAGLLHDIGKSKIPDEILFKPGKLTDDEFALMRNHSQLGVEILLGQKHTTNVDIAVAWGHHIRYDGRGYPAQAPWVQRHPITGLLQICDVFEALTAIRPYKAPMTPLEAYTIMLSDEGGFDPMLLAAFIEALGLYPPGIHVQLSDGRNGIVKATGKRIDRPTIEVHSDSFQRPLPEADYSLLDLHQYENANLSVAQIDLEAGSLMN